MGALRWMAGVAFAAWSCGSSTTSPPDGGVGPHCVCATVDQDGDGFAALPCGGDCDDSAPSISPSAPDPADTPADENCDGTFQEDRDRDGDPASTDCDDRDATVHAGANDDQGLVVETIDDLPAYDSRLLLGPDGVAHVFYHRAEYLCGNPEQKNSTCDWSPNDFHYATNRGGTWQSSPISRLPEGAAFAFDSDGTLHAAWVDDGLVLARFVAEQWESERIATEAVGAAYLAFDSCGAAEVMFATPHDDGRCCWSVHGSNVTGSWELTDTFDWRQTVPEALMIDDQDRPRAVFRLAHPRDEDLRYSTLDGAPDELIVPMSPVHKQVLATGWSGDGEPRLVYSSNYDLFYAERDAGVWSVEPVSVPSEGRSATASPLPDAEGRVGFLIHRVSGFPNTSTLYEARRGPDAFTVRATAIIGAAASAVADDHGSIHLTFDDGEPRPGTTRFVYGTFRERPDGIDQNCDGVDGLAPSPP